VTVLALGTAPHRSHDATQAKEMTRVSSSPAKTNEITSAQRRSVSVGIRLALEDEGEPIFVL